MTTTSASTSKLQEGDHTPIYTDRTEVTSVNSFKLFVLQSSLTRVIAKFPVNSVHGSFKVIIMTGPDFSENSIYAT